MWKPALIAFAVLVIHASAAEAAVAQSLPRIVPGHEGQCWLEEEQIELAPGQSHTTNCVQATCNSDLGMSFYSCGAIHTEKPCYLTEPDYTQDYPECCPQVKCDQ